MIPQPIPTLSDGGGDWRLAKIGVAAGQSAHDVVGQPIDQLHWFNAVARPTERRVDHQWRVGQDRTMGPPPAGRSEGLAWFGPKQELAQYLRHLETARQPPAVRTTSQTGHQPHRAGPHEGFPAGDRALPTPSPEVFLDFASH